MACLFGSKHLIQSSHLKQADNFNRIGGDLEALRNATTLSTAVPTDAALKELRARITTEPLLTRLAEALGSDANLHLVGGSVRDALLGVRSYDFDLATPLLPETIVERLEAAQIRVIATGLKHQTVTAVPIPGGPNVELTTFRGPGMSPAGGVASSRSITEDLRFRDFTINALALELATGQLHDPNGGLDDIAKRTLRCVGNAADRFREDPLRMLRLLRLACSHDLTIESASFAAVPLNRTLLEQVSIERIRDEFTKILLSPNPGRGMRLLARLNLLPFIAPELEACVDLEQNRFHPLDLYEHTIAVIEKTPPDLVLRLAALFHDIGKPPTLTVDPDTGDRHFFRHESIGATMTARILERLRFPHHTIEAIVTLVATHMRPLEAGAGGLRRLLRDTGELFPAWRVLKEADAASCAMDPEVLASQLALFDEAMVAVQAGPPVSPLKSLALNGHDLLAAGVPPGPQVGVLLRALHERVLDDPSLNERERLLEILKHEL